MTERVVALEAVTRHNKPKPKEATARAAQELYDQLVTRFKL